MTGVHLCKGVRIYLIDMFTALKVFVYEKCLQRYVYLQVFTGNKQTCMKVLSYQVQKVTSLVAVHGNKAPQFLEVLDAIVKVIKVCHSSHHLE